MKLNPVKWLLNDKDRKPPVLLAVTPPRTGERTLLGVENMLGSIAVPEPFSLELAGDADGVTLLARCLQDQVVRGQIAARYPQAQIQEIPAEDDPLRLAEGEQAWSMTLRADGPEYVPLRVFRDDDLLDPGSDPLIALMGALSNLNEGERVVARLMLRSLGPDWSQAHLEKAHKRPVEDRRDPVLHLPDPAPPDGRRDDGRAGGGGVGRPAGLPVGAGGRDLEGRGHGHRRRRSPGRRRLALAPHQEGRKAGLRPPAHQGEGLPHRLRRRDSGDGHPAPGHQAQPDEGASGAGGRRLPPLRQPRRGAPEGEPRAARRARPLHAPPVRPRTLRQAQRHGRPRGGLPVAPARSA